MKSADVLEKMQPIMDTTARTIDHGPATRVVVQPDMVTLRPGRGGHHLELGKEGMDSLAKFIGMPQQLTHQLSTDTSTIQKRELSMVSTSSMRISSPSTCPNSNFVSAMSIPRSAA